MIEIDLQEAVCKPHRLKVCHECRHLNWHDNEECVVIGCDGTYFYGDQQNVNLAIQAEYDFYMVEEGMTEEEVDHIYIEV